MSQQHKDKARRLERILKLEQLKARRIEQELAAVEARRAQNTQFQDMLNETLGAGFAAQPGMGDSVSTSIDDLKRGRRYLDTVAATLDQVVAERDRIERDYERSRTAWSQQRRRSEIIEDMSVRAHSAHAQAQEIQEELEIDDLSARKPR